MFIDLLPKRRRKSRHQNSRTTLQYVYVTKYIQYLIYETIIN